MIVDAKNMKDAEVVTSQMKRSMASKIGIVLVYLILLVANRNMVKKEKSS